MFYCSGKSYLFSAEKLALFKIKLEIVDQDLNESRAATVATKFSNVTLSQI